MDRSLLLGLTLGGAIGAAGLAYVISRRRPDALQGLGDYEVHTARDGTQDATNFAREVVRANAIMKAQPPQPRFANTGFFAVLPVTRRNSRAYLIQRWEKAVQVAQQNASGFVPYVVIQVLDQTDWRMCEDRKDVGCGPSRVVAYALPNGTVLKSKAAPMPVPPEWVIHWDAGGDRMVPELGY